MLGLRAACWAGSGAIAILAVTAPDLQAQQQPVKVEVDRTEFRLNMPDGRVVAGADLVGVVIAVAGADGGPVRIRIDSRQADIKDGAGEIVLYGLSVADPASGAWDSLCPPDQDGVALGFPLAGVWTASGQHVMSPGTFSLTCTAGAIGKCVRMGYKPWAVTADGSSLLAYHQACTRMLRADYCGDGSSHTRDGTSVDIADRLGLQQFEAAQGMSFEAGWAAEGASCISRARLPEVATLEAIRAACPARLSGRTGAACTPDAALAQPGTLILNRSRPPG